MAPAPRLVARFVGDLDALTAHDARLGIALSGGPDSLALLLLARAARPRRILAVTVDHALRPDSAAEAAEASRQCRSVDVPHDVLRLEWAQTPASNIQAVARERRYEALGAWARKHALTTVATAHHLDDQAETVLLRLARGAGIGGLSAIQPSRPIHAEHKDILLVRPLLSWARSTLGEVVEASGLKPVEDPSNADARFDRTQARKLLATTDWLDPQRLSAVAANARAAETALGFTVVSLLAGRVSQSGTMVTIDPAGLPNELQRRLLLRGIALLSDATPAGPQLSSVLEALRGGRICTLAGLKLTGGELWHIERAPPRRALEQG